MCVCVEVGRHQTVKMSQYSGKVSSDWMRQVNESDLLSPTSVSGSRAHDDVSD